MVFSTETNNILFIVPIQKLHTHLCTRHILLNETNNIWKWDGLLRHDLMHTKKNVYQLKLPLKMVRLYIQSITIKQNHFREIVKHLHDYGDIKNIYLYVVIIYLILKPYMMMGHYLWMILSKKVVQCEPYKIRYA